MQCRWPYTVLGWCTPYCIAYSTPLFAWCTLNIAVHAQWTPHTSINQRNRAIFAGQQRTRCTHRFAVHMRTPERFCAACISSSVHYSSVFGSEYMLAVTRGTRGCASQCFCVNRLVRLSSCPPSQTARMRPSRASKCASVRRPSTRPDSTLPAS